MLNAWLIHLNQNSLKSIIGSYKITIYIHIKNSFIIFFMVKTIFGKSTTREYGSIVRNKMLSGPRKTPSFPRISNLCMNYDIIPLDVYKLV